MADTPTAAAAIDAVQAKNGTAEAAPETVQTKPPEAKDERFEALARKERQLLKMRKEIESERSTLKSKLAEYETGYIPKQRIAEDPFSVLNDAGISYEKLTEMLLNNPNMNDPAIRALHGQIKKLEQAQADSVKKQEEASQRQYQDAIKQITNEVKQLVAQGDAYETVKEMGMEEAVVELIEQTYNTEGYLLDIAEAARQVEEHLLTEAERMSKLKKLQGRLAPKAEEVTEAIPKQSSNQIKTLTNAVSAQPTKRLSEKDRIARAFAAFNGQLKG